MSKLNVFDKFLCNMLDKVFNALERVLCDPQWRVDVGTYSSGRFEDFYKKEKALKYANSYKGKGYFVDLINKRTEKSVRIDGPSKDKKKDPKCKHEWSTLGSAAWWCSKCGAEFNLACGHSGSIACAKCVEELIKRGIKEEGSWEKYLANESW